MWKPLRDENRLSILKIYGYTCDRLVREEERQNITSISRSQARNWNVKENSRHVKLLERNPVDGY